MNVSDAIQKKRAVRQFDPKPVPDDVMNQILEAGRRAQSSKTTQPWQFIVVRDREMLKALGQTGDFAAHLAGAAFGVVLVGTKVSHWNSFDLGQSAAYFQLAAWELGVGSCIAAIYDDAKAKTLLGVPQEMSCY